MKTEVQVPIAMANNVKDYQIPEFIVLKITLKATNKLTMIQKSKRTLMKI